MRQNAITFNKNEISTPDAVVYGKTGTGENMAPGVSLSNNPQNHLTQNSEEKKISENVETQFFAEKKISENVGITPSEIVEQKNFLKKVENNNIEIVGKGEYIPEYCNRMVEYFENVQKVRVVIETLTWKNGEIREVEKEVPNAPPQFSEFARSIGVTHRTLKGWAKSHTEFNEAYEMCREIFKEFLIANGLTGKYPSQITTFVAKNETDMVDNVTVNNVNFNMKDFLDKLEKGEVK